MFSRKRPTPEKRRNHDLSQFGLTDIPDDFDPSSGYGGHDDANDSDLEAELAAIAGGAGQNKPKQKPKPKLVPTNELDRMIADSLKDVSSDEDDDDAENDADLMGELQNIAGNSPVEDTVADSNMQTVGEQADNTSEQQTFLPTTTVDTLGIIRQRLEMYKQAEANAKAAGEGAKARRLARGQKTLNELLKQASSGKSINVDDIPPEVSVKAATQPAAAADEPTVSTPTRVAPAPPIADDSVGTDSLVSDTPKTDLTPDEETNSAAANSNSTSSGIESPKSTDAQTAQVAEMRQRQHEYKAAALQAKRSGDTAMALQFLKVVKQFDVVVEMYEKGQQVDFSDMPPPPAEFKEFLQQMQAAASAPAAAAEMPEAAVAAPIIAEPQSTPSNMLEALQQRLEKYKSVEAAAKAEDNASKARRFGRIVKQYEDAIKQHKAGRAVAYDELPAPPGYGPLPTAVPAAAAAISPVVVPTSPAAAASPSPSTSAQASAANTPVTTPSGTPTPGAKKRSPAQDLTTRTSGNQQKNNLAEQQMKILLERQKEFKQAALEAKKAGEIEQAKEYLKIYIGFDSLLNAASSGLPVDLNTLPLPPSQRENLESSFAIVTSEECDPNDPDIADIGVRIEEQLAKQLMMCKNTRDHHKAMGDVAGMNRFENLAVVVQKDLDLVRYSKRKNFPLPKFHYEQRSFNIVHCNTDLTDNELEFVVVRGLNYNVPNPKEVDTFVRVEFPLLNDEKFRVKTNVINNNDSPEYDQRFKVDIQRNNRQFQRIFKRHSIKFEVLSRGCRYDCMGLSRILPMCCFRGFFRSDTLIGTVNVKLQALETKTDIHDTFDLMDGRKTTGGKLEIKVRVRNPILTKQMEHINEKWLVLDAAT